MAVESAKIMEKQAPQEIPFILRVLWLLFFGWELTGVWILVAWGLNATIIGLPLGLWMIDWVPQVLTLKSRSETYAVGVEKGETHSQNASFFIRAIYFVLFGWWFSLIWASVAWVLCASIIGLPLGVVMLNALPWITTLNRS